MKHFKQRLTDCANQDWHSSINDSSRCDFYKQFKSLLIPEQYLLIDLRFDLRKLLSNSVVPAINLKSKPAVTATPQGKIGFVNFVSNATVYVLLKMNYTYSLTHSHTMTPFDTSRKQAY